MNAEIEELRRIYLLLKAERERKFDANQKTMAEYDIAAKAANRASARLNEALEAWTNGGM